MIVQCIKNDVSDLKDILLLNRLKQYINLDGPDYDLAIGQNYVVQAVENRGGYWWYYIHSVDVNDYPYPYPAEFFEVLDNSLPSDWSIRMILENNQSALKRISFPDWANDDYFYEKLVDEEPNCKSIYLNHVRKQA